MTPDENAPTGNGLTDLNDVPTKLVSICADCAKHPELQALVTSDLTAGA